MAESGPSQTAMGTAVARSSHLIWDARPWILEDYYGFMICGPEAEALMHQHQKVQGSDFITVSEGTIQVLATEDPSISELAKSGSFATL